MNGIFTLEEAKTEHKFSPKLARAISRRLPLNRFVTDYGCGKGQYLSYLSHLGFKCMGIEGTPGISELAEFNHIKQADLSKPLPTSLGIKSGSSVCLEVIEHIPQEFEGVVIENITKKCTGRLIMSWAVKGQGGCGHVNEQDADYVVPTIEKKGFKLNRSATLELRAAGGSELWWFNESIYVFDRVK